MKIYQQGPNGAAERSDSLRRTSADGFAARDTGPSRSRQVGFDRVDVSHVAETAYRAISIASADREQRIAGLSEAVQSGSYSVDPAHLSASILNHDSEPDMLYAG